MMRKRFEYQLNELNRLIIKMGELLEDATNLAKEALSTQNVESAEKAILGDMLIDGMEKDIETLCLRLLMQQQPVAQDLRVVSSALKIITDMERIGDHAADISEIIIYMAKTDYMSNISNILKMIDISTQMVRDSIKSFAQKDLELARLVLTKDDEVDALFITTKLELIEKLRNDSITSEEAIDLMMISKYLERIGDHAENIAEWVEFAIIGVNPKHQKD